MRTTERLCKISPTQLKEVLFKEGDTVEGGARLCTWQVQARNASWLMCIPASRATSEATINQSISSCTPFLTRGIRHDSIRHEAR
jgi:hypothetical protein